MLYFQQMVNGKMVQVAGAQSVQTCVDYFGGEWVEVKAPPYIGWGDDGNFIPFPQVQPPEENLVQWNNQTKEWVILN